MLTLNFNYLTPRAATNGKSPSCTIEPFIILYFAPLSCIDKLFKIFVSGSGSLIKEPGGGGGSCFNAGLRKNNDYFLKIILDLERILSLF